MLCMRKGKVSEEKRLSRELDIYLKSEERKGQQLQKILLLGTGESGKTTILKQMKIIHLKGFTIEECKSEIKPIKENLHEAISALVTLLKNTRPEVLAANPEILQSANFLRELDGEKMENTYINHVKTVWSDPSFRNLLSNSQQFQRLNNASYFLDRLGAIEADEYIPSVEDILHCRVQTMGISKVEFRVAYKCRKFGFVMYDVGGQRGERRKWLSVFEGVTALLFIIATNDFDLKLREDETKNRLVEALNVFADIFWSRFLRRSGKIVFLNKVDILERIVDRGQCIGRTFPDYYTFEDRNCKSECERTKSFIKSKIIKIAETKPSPERTDCLPGILIKQEVPDQQVYIHFTVATNTNNIKIVFDSVKDIVLTNNLIISGFY